MLKVSFSTLWKLAVVLLLAIIAFYSYRIDKDLSGTYYTVPVGCGATGARALPQFCVQPMQGVKQSNK